VCEFRKSPLKTAKATGASQRKLLYGDPLCVRRQNIWERLGQNSVPGKHPQVLLTILYRPTGYLCRRSAAV